MNTSDLQPKVTKDEVHPNATHGMSFHSEYNIWSGMKKRCGRPENKDFHIYGGKGITVCKRWRDSFENFYEDMGPRPSERHSLDRIDGTKGYEPSNCRWATHTEQCRNKSSNRHLTYMGKTQTITEWAIELDLKKSTISKRLGVYGMSDEEALTRPTDNTVTLTFGGKCQSVVEWAKEIGMDYSSLHKRLRSGMSVHEALTKPKKQTRMLTYNGKCQSVSLWAQEFAMNEQTIIKRLEKGMSVEEALTKPKRGL